MSDPGRLIVDTEPHPVFATYSAGNFAEVAPERLSPLSWSVLGPPVERGMRRVFHRLWPRARWTTGSHFLAVGYFSCKPYHNLSTLCYSAGSVPWLEPEQVTRSYFQNAPVPDLPGARAPWSDQVAALPRLAREFRRARGQAALQAERLVELENAVSTAGHRRSVLGLVELLPRVRDCVRQVWEAHYSTTLMLVPLTAAMNAVGDRLVPYWEELEPLVNRPDELTWDLLADQSADASRPESADFLSYSFYEIADDQEPWAGYDRRACGHGAARTATGNARERFWDTLPRLRAAPLRQLTNLVGVCWEQREHTKALAMRALHLVRQLVPVLVEVRGVEHTQAPYLAFDELIDEAQDVGWLDVQAESRREVCAQALGEPMPEILRTGDTASAEEAASDTAAGGTAQGVSPGEVLGRVVHPDHRDLDLPRPHVLVCDAADADISELLADVDAVVTRRGSALSHVAILLREHGIPGVVGHALADSVPVGQQVRVDGSSGEVSIIDE